MRYYARRHAYVCKDTTNRCIYIHRSLHARARARTRIALYFVLGERTSGARAYRSLTSPSPARAEIRVCINLKLVSIWRGRCARRVPEDVRRTSRCVPQCVAAARAHTRKRVIEHSPIIRRDNDFWNSPGRDDHGEGRRR